MDGASHAGSVSDPRQVIALQRDRVFGHYGLAAQTADDCFISTYARDYPASEDIAESFLTYLAVRYRMDRISPFLNATIWQTIPNRIAYFNAQSLDMHPFTETVSVEPVSWGSIRMLYR